VGPIPAGRLVLHSCDNPPCVNPEHLRAGTQRDNRRDAVIRRRTARGERNAAAKLTDAQFAAIPRRVAAGERQADIAREFGVSRQAIRQYLNRYAAGLEHR
jgi:DNA-directed RNA polymerase specialized sigma24 family protein